MKSYLLDTNICIYYLKGLYGLKEKITTAGISNCYLSEITVAELKFGAERSARKEENHSQVEAFCSAFTWIPITGSLDVYAKEKARLFSIGKPIDEFDLLIGSTAIANDLILVTHNTKHFTGLAGIDVEDWVIR